MKKTLFIIFLCIAICSEAQINLDEGLVAFYPFNGDALDMSGNNHNGTVYGATLTNDRFGMPNSAYFFNGSSDYISIEDHEDLRMSSVSLVAWITFISSPFDLQNIISKPLGNENNDSYVFWWMDGGINGHVGSESSPGPFLYYDWFPMLDDWYFMVYTFNHESNTQKIYINGEEVASGISETEISWDNHPVLIGAESDYETLQYFFFGNIDDILIYNRALNTEEIETLYAHPFSIQEITISLIIDVSPNPLTSSTTIEYEMKQAEKVSLTIYNQMGKQVYQKQENQPQGKQQLIWNAEGYPDGIYYYRLQVGEQVTNGKMVKVR